MSAINSVDCAVMLIRGMSKDERDEVFRQIDDLMPITYAFANTVACINGKEHKYKAIKHISQFFGLVDKTQMVCSGCGMERWI
jgi:hypothetical protein